MTIIFDEVRRRMVDDQTGEYLKSRPVDFEEQIYNYCIIDKNDQPVLATFLQYKALDEAGADSVETIVRYSLKDAWIPARIPVAPKDYNRNVNSSLIRKLVAFLEAQNAWARGHITPPVRFELVDERVSRGAVQ